MQNEPEFYNVSPFMVGLVWFQCLMAYQPL